MKKIFYLLVIIVTSLIFTKTVLATPGTCSSHGGVNCRAGWDYDGSAICNDGWRDSSESYFDQSACKNYELCPLEKMATESYFSCASDEMLHTLRQNKMSGLPKLNPTTESGSFNFENNFSSEEEQLMYYYGDEIRKCEEDIARFKKVWDEYNACQDRKWAQWSNAMDAYIEKEVNNLNQTVEGNKLVEKILDNRTFTNQELNSLNLEQLTYLNSQLKELGTKDKWCQNNQNAPLYNRQTGKCECSSSTYFDQNSQSCSYCPLNSQLNSSKTGCSCKDGFVLNNEKTFCISKDQWCESNLKNSYYDNSAQVCACNEDFSYNIDKNVCEKMKEVEEIVVNNDVVENTNTNTNTQKPQEKQEIKNTPIKIPESSPIEKEVELVNIITTTSENIIGEPATSTQILEDEQAEDEVLPQEKKSITQSVKENTSLAIKHVVNFVKNVFSKLKFW